MSYAIYINGVRLPVNPEKFKQKRSRNLKEFDVLNVGNVGQIENRSLDQFEWEAEFPAYNNNFCVAWQDPSVYIELIKNSMNSKEPVQLVVSNGTEYGLSANVIITSFITQEIEAGGYSYSIICKEYVKPTIVTENVNTITRPAPQKIEKVSVDTTTQSLYDATQRVAKTSEEVEVTDEQYQPVEHLSSSGKFEVTAKKTQQQTLFDAKLYIAKGFVNLANNVFKGLKSVATKVVSGISAKV